MSEVVKPGESGGAGFRDRADPVGEPVPNGVPVEALTLVRQAGGEAVFVQFADGCSGTVELSELGLDAADLAPGAVRAAPSGRAAEFEDRDGHVTRIDSSVVRAQIDADYARRVEQSLSRFRLPKADPTKPTAPPQRWFDEADDLF
jgi:hypothetical protein